MTTNSPELTVANGAWPERLRGVLPVLQLPLKRDESIDFSILRSEVEWLFDRGATGVVVAMVTEVLRLSTQERMQVAEAVCAAAAERGPAVIHVGAESTYSAVELTRQAEAVGASAVMATPPISTRPLPDESVRYFERIIGATRLPVIIQDASGYVGQPLGTALQARMLAKFGADRVAFKPEAAPLTEQLAALRAATAGQARVFEGSGGGALVEAHAIGIHGTMPGADLIEAIVALWSALERGDAVAVATIRAPLEALVALQQGLDGYLAIEKHLLVRQGVFTSATVRGPVSFRLDDATRSLVDERFDVLQAVIRRYQSPTAPSL